MKTNLICYQTFTYNSYVQTQAHTHTNTYTHTQSHKNRHARTHPKHTETQKHKHTHTHTRILQHTHATFKKIYICIKSIHSFTFIYEEKISLSKISFKLLFIFFFCLKIILIYIFFCFFTANDQRIFIIFSHLMFAICNYSVMV